MGKANEMTKLLLPARKLSTQGTLAVSCHSDVYMSFFDLRANPFDVTSDVRFFYSKRPYRNIYLDLLSREPQGEGLILLTGDGGIGKTILVRKLMLDLDACARFVTFPFTELSVEHFLGVRDENLDPGNADTTKPRPVQDTADRRTTVEQRCIRPVILVVDDAHCLSTKTFEAVMQHYLRLSGLTRSLAELETYCAGPLRLLLVGQPKLECILDAPRFQRLKENITFRYRIDRLADAEVSGYIHHRLRLAGCERDDLINSDALHFISRYAEGIPGTINMICDAALLNAYKASKKTVTEELVHKAALELGLREEGQITGLNHPVNKEVIENETTHRRSEASGVGLDNPEMWRHDIALCKGQNSEKDGASEEGDPLRKRANDLGRKGSLHRFGHQSRMSVNALQTPTDNVLEHARAHQPRASGDLLSRLKGAMKELWTHAKGCERRQSEYVIDGCKTLKVPYFARLAASLDARAGKIVRTPPVFGSQNGILVCAGGVFAMGVLAWGLTSTSKEGTVPQEAPLLTLDPVSGRASPPQPDPNSSFQGPGARHPVTQAAEMRLPRSAGTMETTHKERHPPVTHHGVTVEDDIIATRPVVGLTDEAAEGRVLDRAIAGEGRQPVQHPRVPADTHDSARLTRDRKQTQPKETMAFIKGPPPLDSDGTAERRRGEATLVWAAGKGYLGIIKSLVDAGVDVSVHDESGDTALMYSAWNGHVEVARVLLENHADANLKNRDGWTALMYAAMNGHLNVVRVLLRSSALVNTKNHNGDSALVLAARNGHSHIEQALIERGAHIDTTHNDGIQPT